MFINLQKFLKLPVYTESGVKIGQVFDIKFEIESHTIVAYHVRQSFLSRSTHIIKPVHVKEIPAKRIVVYDAVIKAGATVSDKRKRVAEPEMAGNATMREIQH